MVDSVDSKAARAGGVPPCSGVRTGAARALLVAAVLAGAACVFPTMAAASGAHRSSESVPLPPLTQPPSAPALSSGRLVLSGELLHFAASDLQCILVDKTGVQDRSGIVCFKGAPGHIAAGSQVAVLYSTPVAGRLRPQLNVYPAGAAALDRLLSQNFVKRNDTLALGASFRLAGTPLACLYYVSSSLARGQRAVACYATDTQGPLPNTYGFLIDDRLVGFVGVDSNRHLRIDVRMNH